MKVVAFAGALRKDSLSKKLIHEAVRLLNQEHSLIADHIDLKDYPFPVYDYDIEQSVGIPDSIAQIGARIGKANALVIASPEYNGGISSVLKTLIDWLSRLRPDPLGGKFLLLLSASPSSSGGVQGLWHTRVPFEVLGVHVFPYMVAVPRSQTAFDEHGTLTDSKTEQKLRDALHAFVIHVEKHHPLRQSQLSNVI